MSLVTSKVTVHEARYWLVDGARCSRSRFIAGVGITVATDFSRCSVSGRRILDKTYRLVYHMSGKHQKR